MELKDKTTAIYCRVACADELTMKKQEQLLCQFAEQQTVGGVTVYKDNGFSGLNLDRPAFSQMEADMKSGKINAVIVKDETRIGWCVIQVSEWIANAKLCGIPVITLDSNENYLLNEIQ